MDFQVCWLLYFENIGFRYEIGGMMEVFWVLIFNRICEFYKVMYQFQNLVVIIIGEVDYEDLLKILDMFEESIKDDILLLNFSFKCLFVDFF